MIGSPQVLEVIVLTTEGKTGATMNEGRKILNRNFTLSQAGGDAERVIGLVKCQHKTILRWREDRIVHGNLQLLGNLQIGVTSSSTNNPSEIRMVNDTMENRNGVTIQISNVGSTTVI
jgi:hypothetical protein